MKKLFPYILILIVLAGIFSATAKIYAADYVLLSPLPCDPSANPPTPGCNSETKTITTFNPATGLGAYLNLMIKIFKNVIIARYMIYEGHLTYSNP